MPPGPPVLRVLVLALVPAAAVGWHAGSAHAPRGVRVSRGAARMMYSDSKPTIEYFDYLANGEEFADLNDGPSVIVGGGRIGDLLYNRCGWEGDILLKRGDKIPADFEGPVHVCTRNADVAEVIENCPDSKIDDLVFWQNPMMDPVLKKYALVDNTQVNVYFAVPTKGAAPIDGITAVNPEGLTSATGKWAQAVMQRLARAELSCKLQNKRDFKRTNIEKHIWLCVFNVIGTAQGHASGKKLTMGEVSRYHFKEVEPMVRQLGYSARTFLSAAPPEGLEERLRAYANAVSDFPCAMKEFKWRNGFWYDYSTLCKNKGFPDNMDMHTEYVEYCIENDLIESM